MRPHLPALAAVVAGIGAVAGCGSVRFVKSPYGVGALEVVYSAQERVTFFAWQLAADIDPDAVRFELATGDGWAPVEFEKAPFPAGSFECANATCFRWSLRGRYVPTADSVPLRSVHVHHGFIAGPSVFVEERAASLAFAPAFVPDNVAIELAVDDLAAPSGSPLRRSFRWRHAASEAACIPSGGAWAGETEGVERIAFEGEPSEAGRYCVELQPVALDGGEAVTVAAVALSHPTLLQRSAHYEPPREEAPVVYKLLVDLEIPNALRCQEAIAAVVAAAKDLERGGPFAIALDPLFLSQADGSKCRQRSDRALDVAAVVREVRETIRLRVPQAHGAPVLFIYVNNLAMPLPPTLAVELFSLREALAEEERTEAFLWALAAEPVIAAGGWNLATAWTNPTSRAFRELFVDFTDLRLPVRTMLHDDRTRVPFIDSDLHGIPGGFVKLCSSTPPVALTLGGLVTRERTLAFVPGQAVEFAVHFEPQLRVQAGAPEGGVAWKENSVELTYEVCTRWCSHPFMALDGTRRREWHLDETCRGAAP